VQRRQLSTLERGGNVTLNTLRKVIGFLPNLKEFTFEQVRMKPTYIDVPPFEWQEFYANMYTLHETLDGMKTALKEWLDNPPSKEVDPEVLTKRTTNLASEILKQFAKLSLASILPALAANQPRLAGTQQPFIRITSPRHLSRWWLATAAVIALSVTGVLLLRDHRVSTLSELADMHVTLLASTNPVDVLSTDRHTVKTWFEGRVPFGVPVPDLAHTPFRLIGGRVVYVESRQAAYLLIAKDAHRISLFIFTDPPTPRPAATDREYA
jgi:anti-sigma factor RsiW